MVKISDLLSEIIRNECRRRESNDSLLASIERMRQMSPAKLLEEQVSLYNRSEGALVGLDCPECLNRGYFAYLDSHGVKQLRECTCMAERRTLRRLQKTGLGPILSRYTFDGYQPLEPWQASALNVALNYTKAPQGWLLASGSPGTGKTHLCTCVCIALTKNGLESRYVLWRDMSTHAKAVVTDADAYAQTVEPLKSVPLLYIDDFLKTRQGREPTDGDVNLAFEILNARYMSQAPTIISTEKSPEQLMAIDEALASRIIEMARNSYMDFSERPNWRVEPR